MVLYDYSNLNIKFHLQKIILNKCWYTTYENATNIFLTVSKIQNIDELIHVVKFIEITNSSSEGMTKAFPFVIAFVNPEVARGFKLNSIKMILAMNLSNITSSKVWRFTWKKKKRIKIRWILFFSLPSFWITVLATLLTWNQ